MDFSFLRRIKEEERYETRREMQKCIESLFEEILNLFQCNVRVQDHYRDSNGKIVWYSIDGDFTTIEEITKRVKIVFMRTRKTMFEQGMMSKPYLPYLPCDIDFAMNINKDLCVRAFRYYPHRHLIYLVEREKVSKVISDNPFGEFEDARRCFNRNAFQKALDKIARTRNINELKYLLDEKCCCFEKKEHNTIYEDRVLCINHIIDSFVPKRFNFNDIIKAYYYYESLLLISDGNECENEKDRNKKEIYNEGSEEENEVNKEEENEVNKEEENEVNKEDYEKHCRKNLSEINKKMIKLRDTLWYTVEKIKKADEFSDTVLNLLENIEYFCCFIMIKNTEEL